MLSNRLLFVCLVFAAIPHMGFGWEPTGENAIVFPKETWQKANAAKLGWDQAKLNACAAYAGEQRSSGLVVVHHGQLVLDKKWDLRDKRGAWTTRYKGAVRGVTEDGSTIEDVASVQKSVVSTLTAIAIEKGLLTPRDPVSKHLGKGWSQATEEQESKILVKHLLSMSSGLSTQLKYVAPPGTKWSYNTTAYAKLQAVLAKAAKQPLQELTTEWLLKPIGMQESKWVSRGQGGLRAGNTRGFATIPKDLARFGLLILAKGKWHEETVLKEKSIDAMLRSSQPMNPSYGYLWWLNGKQRVMRAGQSRAQDRSLNEAAPADMFGAFGAMGRRVYISPGAQLVVVRMGAQPASRDFEAELWKKLRAAMPSE